MSNLSEIKQRLDRLKQLGKTVQEQLKALKGPEGEALKKKAKKEGTRIGVGVGLSIFGLIFAAVASVYITGVVILLVNIALDRLWLSALIVVGGFMIIGGVIIAIGAAMARSSAKRLSRSKDDITKQMKQAGEQMKTEAEELVKLARSEAEIRQKQVADIAKKAAPAVGVAFLACRLLKRAMKARRENRAILKVIELYEEARAREESS